MSFAADTLPARLAPIIFGCEGFVLTPDEVAFFKDASPAGFILFKKNCHTPDQTRALVDSIRATVGWPVPVLIDQEGGRVQRLRPPHWPDFPPPRNFGDLYKKDVAKGLAALTADIEGLASVQCAMGIDVNCIPCLDVVPDGTGTRAIDDRAFANDAQTVGIMGVHATKAAIAAGMTPVMKHMPGHGRATVDSHFDLPRVDTDAATLAQTDFTPFKKLASEIPNNQFWGMSAHVIYKALDPDLPATLSPTIITDVIRGAIGFDGLLLTDDLFMEALAPWGDTAARAGLAVNAGIDIALFCHGTVEERQKAAIAVGQMTAEARKRFMSWHTARTAWEPRKPVDTLLSEMARALA